EFNKNTPWHLGLAVNLTDWLPARKTDTVEVTIQFNALQGAPIRDLLAKLKDNDLLTKVTALRPEWEAAMKVSSIAGGLLSGLLGEGKEHVLYHLREDLNLASLKSGFYASMGSNAAQPFPKGLKIENGRLVKDNGDTLIGFNYVMLEVEVLPRRGEEV